MDTNNKQVGYRIPVYKWKDREEARDWKPGATKKVGIYYLV